MHSPFLSVISYKISENCLYLFISYDMIFLKELTAMIIREAYLAKIRPFIGKDYPKYVLYKEGTFHGNYEGIPAVKVEEWLTK